MKARSQFVAIGGVHHIVVWHLPVSNVELGQAESWNFSREWTEAEQPGQLPPPRPRLSFDGQLATLGIWHEGLGDHFKSNDLRVVSTRDGQPAGPVISPNGSLIDSCICTDNRSVAAVSYNTGKGMLSVYDIASGRANWPAISFPSAPLCVPARPSEPQLTVLCCEGELLIVQSETGNLEVREISDGRWRISSAFQYPRVAYSPDGSTLVVLSPSSQLFVHEASTGKLRLPAINPVSHGGPLPRDRDLT